MFWTFYIISILISLEIFFHYKLNLIKEETKNEIKFKEKLSEKYDVDEIIKNRFALNFDIIVFLFVVSLIPVINILFSIILIFNESKYFEDHYTKKICRFIINIIYKIFKNYIKEDLK